jgi:hypothetical protein
MDIVNKFRMDLIDARQRAYATWQKVDLHNHSPRSFDYIGDKTTAVADTAQKLNERDIAVVMFTDHGELPDKEFTDAVARQIKALVIRGVELNVFADAFEKPTEKISSQAFFHLLVGFDPQADFNADYWLQRIYHECGKETRTLGGQPIDGIKSNLDKLIECLKDANAIVIPAHLHTKNNSFKSRSIDDIYADERFLSFLPKFTALEVTDPRTAEYFDGKHSETKNAEKTCIQSSDAHEADRLGVRPTWVLMQEPTFSELKASLEIRARISLEAPSLPDCFVYGIHVEGVYLKNFWLGLSPHCNVFIGVKGSGKTAALECLRFVLGVEVPRNSRDQVKAHLTHILGSTGRVGCLVRRSDGSDVLIERSMANPDQWQVTFPGDRVEAFTQVQALGFPAQILGWHEIEHAATDRSVRRKYLDGIAGFDAIARLEGDIQLRTEKVKYQHDQTASKYQTFRTLNDQVKMKEELRRGLKELEDGQLIKLRDDYDAALAHRDEIRRLAASLPGARLNLRDRANQLLPFFAPVLPNSSPLDGAAQQMRTRLDALLERVDAFRNELDAGLVTEEQESLAIVALADEQFSDFTKSFEAAVWVLTDEQRRLLDSHRAVTDQTRDLPTLQAQCQQAKSEVETQLKELIATCEQITALIDERAELRRSSLAVFERELDAAKAGVKLELLSSQNSETYEDYSNKFKDGLTVYREMESAHSGERTLHRRLKRAYEALLADLVNGYRLLFTNAEFSHYLTITENDDLSISFDPYGNGGYKPIDQLSAGQRCTAMFPLLLQLKQGPLVIDQPEDNLDNRHIASKISPVITRDKAKRQIIMTSHNANLLVLSDPENVVVYEGTGVTGVIVEQGFLATRESKVTKHVLDILDGGEKALEMRYAKYGGRVA